MEYEFQIVKHWKLTLIKQIEILNLALINQYIKSLKSTYWNRFNSKKFWKYISSKKFYFIRMLYRARQNRLPFVDVNCILSWKNLDLQLSLISTKVLNKVSVKFNLTQCNIKAKSRKKSFKKICTSLFIQNYVNKLFCQ